MVVIAIKINENPVIYYFGLTTGIGEDLFRTNIALLYIRQIGIDNNLYFLIDAMLQQALNLNKVVLGHLNYGLAYTPGSAVPIRDKVLAFVLRPFVKKIVILHPIFAKLNLRHLSIDCYAGKAKESYEEN